MLLTSILCVPLLVGAALPGRAAPRRLVEWLNPAGFAALLVLGVKLCRAVAARRARAP